MVKQYIIVRKDLEMSKSKFAVQVSHAATQYLSQLIKDNMVGDIYSMKNLEPQKKYLIDHFYIDQDIYDDWLNQDYTKVILQAKNKNQLLKVQTLAEELGFKEGKDFWKIYDRCYTELTPEEPDGTTLTCIGFRPMLVDDIYPLTSKYQLYREAKNNE